MANSTTIYERLIALQDKQYASFQQKLLPTVQSRSIIGVRTPALRSLAKELVSSGEAQTLFNSLPHKYFEENQLHAFCIALTKDYTVCIRELESFLPYVDNWATCDQLSPKCFAKHHKELLSDIQRWIHSSHEYTVRFAICMLMQHFLEKDFEPLFHDMVASICREEYYIRMMQAWYFATALAKQYDITLPYLEKRRLEQWVHNKTIQKAVESYRITEEQKSHLKSLRWK